MKSYHPITEELASNVIASLKSHLPYSLALIYRIRSSIRSNAVLYDSRHSQRGTDKQLIFVIAVVDRTQWPMTEVWLYCSFEQLFYEQQDNILSEEASEKLKTYKNITKDELRSLLIMVHQNGTRKRTASGKIPPLLVGSLSNCLLDLICPPAYPNSLVPLPHQDLPLLTWRKYFVSLPCISQTSSELDITDLWLSPLKPQHISLVQKNSPFPRERETLLKLQSMALYPKKTADADPIAWAYLSLDGSLQSLHVEPSYRRRGLGKYISSALMNTQREFIGLAHADVASENYGSVRIFENLGGEWTYEIHWIHLDLTALL